MDILFQLKQDHNVPFEDKEKANLLKTCLKESDVNIYISSLSNINLKDFDIVHIFDCNEISETYSFYRNAVNQRKQIVMSPFFKDMHEYYGNNYAMLAAWRVNNLLRREMMQGSHMLFLYSQNEKEWIQNILYVDTPAIIIGTKNNPQDILNAYQQAADRDYSLKVKENILYTQVYQLPVFVPGGEDGEDGEDGE